MRRGVGSGGGGAATTDDREAPVLAALHAARAAAVRTFHERLPEMGRAARLRAVHAACRLTGFLPEGAEIRTVRCTTAAGPLLVVLNPRRARPHAVHPLPPPLPRPPCPLCDLPWNQLWLELELAGVRWRAAPSPAPYLPVPQWTVATAVHRPQEPADGDEAHALFAAMTGLLERVPGLLLGWNGVGAGASLPAHRHFHALDRAAARLLPRPGGEDAAVLAFAGPAAAVAEGLARALLAWRAEAGEVATANAALWTEGGRIHARFVRRDRRRERLPALSEVRAGFLEAAFHTVILRTPDSIAAFERGRLGAEELAASLTALRPDPGGDGRGDRHTCTCAADHAPETGDERRQDV